MQADRLLVLTDVPAVMAHFGTPQAVPLPRLDLDDLARMRFPAGSMGPKTAACHRFVAATGRRAAIGSLSEATAVLDGSAGTTITAGRTRRTDARPGPRPGPGNELVQPVPTNATVTPLTRPAP